MKTSFFSPLIPVHEPPEFYPRTLVNINNESGDAGLLSLRIPVSAVFFGSFHL